MAPRRLKCLFRGHQWHNGWDDERRTTMWTCKRCGVVRARRTPIPRDIGGLGGGGFG